MKYRYLLVLSLILLLGAWKCSPVEQNARNAAAALNGAIVNAQANYGASCKANPSQTVCVTINKGVAGQNALITAVQTYCGWSASTAPSDATAKCVPDKTHQAQLQAAIANANQLITEIGGLK